MLNFIMVVLGVTFLTLGGEALIRGALELARRLNISPLLSGLLIVGFGTSMPELVVSISAALDSKPDIAIGNVVGSNIGNILLILGTSALITPLFVRPLVLRRDATVMVGAAFLFLLLTAEGGLGAFDGVVLLAGLLIYLAWACSSEKLQSQPTGEFQSVEDSEVLVLPKSWFLTISMIFFGLIGLMGGAHVLLKGAVGMAVQWGVSEAVVGLTLVAIGTSLPEFAISVIAAVRGQADVAVGNILGSNIFNLLGILGVSAILQPLSIHGRVLHFDQWVMIGASLILLLFLYTGRRLSRIEGCALLAGYVVYLALSFSPSPSPF